MMTFEEEFDDKSESDDSIKQNDNILKMIQSYIYFQIWKGICFGQVEFLYKYK